jgi:diguanylate cyclase (GGDEF)-like protein
MMLAYLLGAVVPLVTLGVVIERYVLAPIGQPDDAYSALGANWLTGLFTSITLLSLGCFFVLHRLKRSLEENQALAFYDSLTGLPNRRMYKARLERALVHARRRGGLVATCFLDLDGFKRINDTLGHSSGDRLLGHVAKRLVGCVRSGDPVARGGSDEARTAVSRLGGDEFTFLLAGITDAQDAGRVAYRVLQALRKPFPLDRQEVFTTASIGISIFPLDGEDAETLLINAEAAMYSAKDRGRNNYQFYSRSMNEVARRKFELEHRLHRALECDDLSLCYQPVRETVSGRTVGAEALLRWEDAEAGTVSPSEFVPISEETGLIVELGEWVLSKGCAQLQAWQEAGFRPIRMAVNVSGHQLRHPRFVETVARALRESGLSPAYLELEVTESTIMQDDAVTGAVFQELGELGVGIVLDDFGTGYSSLSYLRNLPIDRLKIDQSFVAELPGNQEDGALTAAIIAMAHSLQLSVVAEGVETLEQAEFLRELGCDDLQGFLFSRAIPAEEFARFLELEKSE